MEELKKNDNNNNNNNVVINNNNNNNNNVKYPKKRAIGDLFDINMLIEIRKIFSNNDSNNDDSLNEMKFREVMKNYLTLNEIEEIYPKIDINDDKNIEWHEFTSFLINSEGNSQFAIINNSYRLIHHNNNSNNLKDNSNNNIKHTDMISHIKYSLKPFPMIITGGRDGQLLIWRLSDVSLVKKITHESKSTEAIRELNKTMTTTVKALVNLRVANNKAKHASEQINGISNSTNSNKLVITALGILYNSGHICVGSSDYCMTVYEAQSSEIVGRYINCKDIPTTIETFYLSLKKTDLAVISPSELEAIKNAGGNINTIDSSISDDYDNLINPIIVIGDAQGGLTLLRLHQTFGITADAGVVRKKNGILFKEAMDQSLYLPVHYDWITKIIYIEEVGQMVTASLDGCICFIEMNKFTVTRIFYGHCSPQVQSLFENNINNNNNSNRSSNVNSRATTSHSHNKQTYNNINNINNKSLDTTDSKEFLTRSKSILHPDNDSICAMDSSKMGKYVASGGGRQLLIWDPFTLKVVYNFDGFSSPITTIIIRDEVELIFICTVDKNIHLYHSITYELLQVVTDPTYYRPQNIITDLLYVGGEYRKLFSVGDKITTWLLERGTEIDNIRENDDICVALYNSLFQQIITVYKSGIVTVHLIEDNGIVTEFDTSTTATDIDTDNNNSDNNSNNKINNNKKKLKKNNEIINIPFIVSACFDKLQRRLIISTRQNTIQLWNFNNGECLQIIEPQLPTMKNNIPLGNIKISSLSCDDAYLGVRKALRKFIFFGSTNGFAIGLQDCDGEFLEEPNFILIEKNKPTYISNNNNTNKYESSDSLFNSSISNSSLNTSVISDINSNSVILNNSNDNKIIDNNQIDKAILWLSCEADDKLFVSHTNGLLAMWDLDKADKCIHIDINKSEVLLDCMSKINKQSTSKAGISTVMKLLSRKSTLSKATNLINNNNDNNNENNNNENNTELTKLPSASFVRRPSLSTKNGLKIAPIIEITPTIEKNEENDSSTDSDTNISSNEIRESDNELSDNEENDIHMPIKPIYTHGIVPLEDRKNILISPFHTITDAPKLKNILNLPNNNNNNNNNLISNKNVYHNRGRILSIKPKNNLFTYDDDDENSIIENNENNNNENMTISDNQIHGFGEDSAIFSTYDTKMSIDNININESIDNFETYSNNYTNSIIVNNNNNILIPKITIKKSNTFKHQNRKLLSNYILEEDDDNRIKENILQKTRKLFIESNKSNSEEIINLASNENISNNIIITNINNNHIDNINNNVKTNLNNNRRRMSERIHNMNILMDKSSDDMTNISKSNEINTVTCAIMLKTQLSVLIGACSDKHFRFWYIPTTYTLCTCRYTDMGLNISNDDNNNKNESKSLKMDEIELCTSLTINNSENLLIGGFDNGKIRIWKLTLQSLIALYNNHIQTNITSTSATTGYQSGLSKLKSAVKKGMAVSPLTFLCEWDAHDSSIVNVQYIFYQEPDNDIIPEKLKSGNNNENNNNNNNNKENINNNNENDDINKITNEINKDSSDEEDDETKMKVSIHKSMEKSIHKDYDNSDNNNNTNSNTNNNINNNTIPKLIKRIPHGQRLISSNVRNVILKLNINNSLIYADDIITLMPNIDGFLVTSGKDQVVYLWSIVGELIGRIGGSTWNILDIKTWGKGKYISPENKCLQIYNSKTLEFEKNAATYKSSILRGGYYDSDGNFHKLYISRYDKHGNCNPLYQKGLSQFLNEQVDEMIQKNRHRRLQSSSAIQNDLFNKLTNKHPYINILKNNNGIPIPLPSNTINSKLDKNNLYRNNNNNFNNTGTVKFQNINNLNSSNNYSNSLNNNQKIITPYTSNSTHTDLSYHMDLTHNTVAGDHLAQLLNNKLLESTNALNKGNINNIQHNSFHGLSHSHDSPLRKSILNVSIPINFISGIQNNTHNNHSNNTPHRSTSFSLHNNNSNNIKK